MTNETIKDDIYVEIDDEFEQIRTGLGMYISKLGTDGARHIIKELTNNEFDEAVNPEALDTKFDVIFDEVEQSYSTVDYSRGIPFDKLVDVCTKKHTSTKFNRDDDKMKDQAGRNGVGLVVSAATAKYFSMESYRGDKSKLVEVVDGEIVDHDPVPLKKSKHGLAVKYVPSPEYLKGPVKLECEHIQNYLRKMSYIMRDDIIINYYEKSKEMSTKKTNDITHIKYTRQGLTECVKYLSNSLEFAPVYLYSVTDDFDLELAFSYDKTVDDTIVDSFCNYINTTEGGYHETVALRAICDFFCREAKKLDPNSKYEVIFDDCKKGLIYSVNCRHKDPAFEGQHKSRVSNKDVLTDGKRGLTKALYEYFNTNNGLLRKIIAYLRTISKVRSEAHKIKGVAQKKATTFMDDNNISMYYPLANRNYNGYTELIIAEGESAANAFNIARNNTYQAIIGVMGVVGNTYGLDPLQAVNKYKAFANIATVLGCGVGKNFDITKLKFSKIIFGVDADADGSNIASLLLQFFITCMPGLIIHGKIYKALPPLLILEEKSIRKWYKGPILLYSREYYNVINTIIADNIDISLCYNDDDRYDYTNDTENEFVEYLSKKKALNWLKMNNEYILELDHLKARLSSDPIVIEYVCWAEILTLASQGDLEAQGNFKNILEKRFPELRYDVNNFILDGSLNGESVSLIIDDIFWHASKKFIKILCQNPSLWIFAKNKNDKNDDYSKFTIGEFLYEMNDKFIVKIAKRYKGIGEMNPDVIFDTTLNPKMRKLIRFTLDNMESTLETFKILHGKTASMRQERRNLLDNSEISYLDLDN